MWSDHFNLIKILKLQQEMEKVWKPKDLSIDPNSSTATKQWRHWKRNFMSYVKRFISADRMEEDQLEALINCTTPDVYEYIDHCETYTEAEEVLEKLYVKTPNDIFARHLLRTAKQKINQSLEDFRCTLLRLAKDCQFKAVTAMQYKEEMVRDSFIDGIASSEIRQRLLEHKTLTLEKAFEQAVTLEDARRDNRAFGGSSSAVDDLSDAVNALEVKSEGDSSSSTLATARSRSVCMKCGSSKSHDYRKCPAKLQTCFKCGEKGHYSRACHLQKKSNMRFKNSKQESSMAVYDDQQSAVINKVPSLCMTSLVNKNAEDTQMVSVTIKNLTYTSLIDTGSSKSYIRASLADQFGVEKIPMNFRVSMAQSSNVCEVTQVCKVDLKLFHFDYSQVSLFVMEELCVDILLGKDFMKQHKRVTFEFGGKKADLVVPRQQLCAVAKADVDTPSLFSNLRKGWKPIATKSRRYNDEGKKFIASTVGDWRKAGTVRPSNSPWRAQCVIVRNKGRIERLAIDYSQTINVYTEKDSFPIPLIEEIVNQLASYKYYASFDLKRAYHQIPIPECDKQFTAFEADGELLEFNVIPFGVTNGGPVFQRIMRNIIETDNLDDTFVYFDNVVIGANSLEELKVNSERFRKSMKSRKMTLNESKTVYGTEELNMLGYRVGHNQIKPDPERLQPLLALPPPATAKALQRAMGLFAYYARWIANFSDKIVRLKKVKRFPLNKEEVSDFENLKKAIAAATLQAIDEAQPFVVECDASDKAISATLNQNGRPVAFMSRSLQGAELAYPAVEKEATSIIEAVRKWNHLLMRKCFTLVTDQKSVAFMLDSRKRTKIKNNKILCWRLELSQFSYDIRYRPGCLNVGPDTLTRAFCASVSSSQSSLDRLHQELCCPGITRLWHYVRVKNLPYALEDVKRCCKDCETCSELKPRFYVPEKGTLIKATQPMERLNIDFKGPLPTESKNRYFLCIIDEFSRYPFCFPCADVSADTVIKCLQKLFSMFGTCSYVHSDRGTALVSRRLKDFLLQKGVATSHSTPYHPQGNSQVERYNGVIWKAVRCALKSRKLPIGRWESVLPEALDSIRSLLCTATNQTPHLRFFTFSRRSPHGRSLPDWLSKPGPVLLRKFIRSGKNDDMVRKVELLEANPMYARIKYPDGRESNVSLRDLSRCPHEVIRTRSTPMPPRFQTQEEVMMEQTNPSDKEAGLNQSVNADENMVEEMRAQQHGVGEDQQEESQLFSDMGVDVSGNENPSSTAPPESRREPRRSMRLNRGVPPLRYGEAVEH